MTLQSRRRAHRAVRHSFGRRIAVALLVCAAPAAAQTPLAKVSVVAPPMTSFLVEATLPVPPETVVEGAGHVPLALSSGGIELTTQVEIVSRYPHPAQGADVVELIARVQRPAGVAPGEEFELDVVAAQQSSGTIELSPAVESLLRNDAVNLRANDLFGNGYRADLLHRVRTGHASVTAPRDGALLKETRSHEVMRPEPGGGQGASAPGPHMLGAHVFTRTYANENFVILDLLLHNGMVGTSPSSLDDPIDDVYFDRLEIDAPAGWIIEPAVETPLLGDQITVGGRERRALVDELRYGQFHFVPQQAQFSRRILLARGQAALQRGRAVLRRETRGFCVPDGDRLWSWWHPDLGRFQATNAPLPALDHLSRADLTNSIRTDYESHAEQIRSGVEGGYPRYSAILGWAQPWGVQNGGMTGGDEIDMYPNVAAAWIRDPVALRSLELRARAYVDRHPVALFDLRGLPPQLEEHVVGSGANAFVPTGFYLLPSTGQDYFGLESVDRRFTEAAYLTARLPYYKKDLEDFRPIDFGHLIRFLAPQLGLVWLANDSLAKLELELSGALFRFSFHENLNSAWGYVQGTGLRARIEEAGLNPAQGGAFGREVGWAMLGTVAHYAVADPVTRARYFPWFQTVARTARRSQSACTGNTTAILTYKAFKGLYRTRQSFEAGYFTNAAEALRTTVLDTIDPETAGLLADLVIGSAYASAMPPFWNPIEQGEERVVAVRPADLALPEFCTTIPENGLGEVGYWDKENAMPAWSYAYRLTGDGLFLQRAAEALGGSGNALAELEARGLIEIGGTAPMFALLQDL